MATDSDVLFVVLAVKLGFANPVPAEQAEALEESLTPVARVAVRAAVAAHVAMAGGDASRAVENLRNAQAAGRSTSGVRAAPPARYRLGVEIGRDAASRVVEAHDPELKREVAVRVPLEEVPPGPREQLTREAELMARLQHPNILPVYDLGRDRGAPMVVMMRAPERDMGAVLRDLAAGAPGAAAAWPRARLLRIFAEIARGVAFAHHRGVIHRDLRPSAVRLGDFGEVLIANWSSAKDKGGAPASAEGGATAWRSPERAQGLEDEVDERSDVYSLGAILYALLALRPPFEGSDAADLMEKVRGGVKVPPSKKLKEHAPKSKAVPAALDKLVMKAMSVRRADRQADASEVLVDIRRYLDDQGKA
ncbi:MAG: serine/threonine protein kinase [Planctomycetia bacterium]|nr:serine/threonine protein kinase [Planctomycetia bacterium]